jgi:hypothetical protein
VKSPKLEEHDEIDNSDAVDTRTDQSGSDEETPTTSAASATFISWTYGSSPHIFTFTGDWNQNCFASDGHYFHG